MDVRHVGSSQRLWKKVRSAVTRPEYCDPGMAQVVWRGVVLICVGWCAIAVAVAQEPVPARWQLGMNLAPVSDWSGEWVFADAFQSSREWFAQLPGGKGPFDTGEKIATTPEGWPLLQPGQAAATLMYVNIAGRYPAGTYTCRYEGDGALSFDYDAVRVTSRGDRGLDVEVRPTHTGILLRVDRSNPADPVRNIRFYVPGWQAGAGAFHPLFVERLRPFRVLRFMDWQQTNLGMLEQWSQRSTPQAARQTTPVGVAPELMIELCNELGADPWFCMPHRADDDFVRQFATLVRDSLHPHARVYVEWTNEAWNNAFTQAAWVHEQAASRKLDWTQVIAAETARDWTIWRDVFGPDAARVVRVVGGQMANAWIAEKLAEHLAGEFDAITCAGYFGLPPEEEARLSAGAGPEEVLLACRRNLAEFVVPQLQDHCRLARTLSSRYGRRIPVVIYEGGQHLTTYGAERPWGEAYGESQSHPLMGALYRQLLRNTHELGIEAFVAYNYVGRPTLWGSWGHLAAQDDDVSRAPKFQALLDALQMAPP